MEHIGPRLEQVERNMHINSTDPIAKYGFTQLPNFILKDPRVSVGAKTAYALLLSYGWHEKECFPGQERLAADMGMGVSSVNRFIKELEDCSLVEIARRGQGKTNFYTMNFVVQKKKGKS